MHVVQEGGKKAVSMIFISQPLSLTADQGLIFNPNKSLISEACLALGAAMKA